MWIWTHLLHSSWLVCLWASPLRWAFPLISDVLRSRARLTPGEWCPSSSLKWLSRTFWPIQTQPRSVFASHCNLRSQLLSLQSSSAWNCILGNCLFSTLSLSLSYFLALVLGWLSQRSCLDFNQVQCASGCAHWRVAQLEARHTILKQMIVRTF